MRKLITVHFFLRILPFALSVLLVSMDFVLCPSDGREFRICCLLFSGPVISVMFPLSHEETGPSVKASLIAVVYYLLAVVPAGLYNLPIQLLLGPSMLMILIYNVVRMGGKYKEVASLFRRDAIWCFAAEDSRTFYSALTLTTISLFLPFHGDRPVPMAASVCGAAAAVLLDVLMHRKSYSGHTMLLSHKKERRIQGIITSNTKSGVYVPEVEVNILAQVYKKVCRYMKMRRPYLDDSFTLENFADAIKVNKLYISRAINKYAGKNFRQFVNHHRVMYSVELMKQDPWLKIIELSFMCGFHSVVTYNLAFKMFLDETPSDMLTRIRLAAPRRAASMIAEEEPEDEGEALTQDEQD